jgi:hypothetical protein
MIRKKMHQLPSTLLSISGRCPIVIANVSSNFIRRLLVETFRVTPGKKEKPPD